MKRFLMSLLTILGSNPGTPESVINVWTSLLRGVKHPKDLIITPDSQVTPDSTAYHKAVFKELREIKSNQNIILKNIQDLHKLHKLCPTKKSDNGNDDEEDYSFSDIKKLFPLSTLDQMNFVEEKLRDESIYNQMVTMLSQIGGETIDTGIKLMLRKLITNEVAMQYSLQGARGKMPFKELNMYSTIYDTVRKNKYWQDCTDVQIEVAITNWLRHARGRCESSRKRLMLSPL